MLERGYRASESRQITWYRWCCCHRRGVFNGQADYILHGERDDKLYEGDDKSGQTLVLFAHLLERWQLKHHSMQL